MFNVNWYENRYKQRLTAKIVEFDRPRRFVDEMVKGAFSSLRHIHEFFTEGDHTLMRDTLIWRSPLGLLGAIADNLLVHLDHEGLTVPVPIPTTDGRLFADGLVVMTYAEGGPPETEADWRRVADTLRQLHRLTQGWPQRPGWRSSTDLLHAETGTKIDLGAMPREGVARCRAAWARLIGRQTCVVHGNPDSPGNIRMTADRVALIDWDESHVDVPDLDLVLPHNAAGLDDGAHDIAAQASAAWEAAVCWDDEYSLKRLAEVRAL